MNELNNILFDTIKTLGFAGVIKSPFQVAIIEYNIINRTNRYHRTVYNDKSEPILMYHPHIKYFGSHKNGDAIEELHELGKYENNKKCRQIYKACLSLENPIDIYKFLFDNLYSIYFHNPVTRVIIDECIVNNTHTHFQPFNLRHMNYGSENRSSEQNELWELGVELERILLRQTNSYYSNTFFYGTDKSEIIYCIGCFTSNRKLANKIVDLIDVVLEKHSINDFIQKKQTGITFKMLSITLHDYYHVLLEPDKENIESKYNKKIGTINEDIKQLFVEFNDTKFNKILSLLNNIQANPNKVKTLIEFY